MYGRIRICSTLRSGESTIHNEFTAIVERDGKWFIAYCPEVSGTNGQGRTKSACLKNLAKAIQLIREYSETK